MSDVFLRSAEPDQKWPRASSAPERTHLSDNITVIIPCRNGAATLAKSLRSLKKQTFRRWRAIIVDDGSTDGSRRVAEQWAKADRRIISLRQAPLGAAAARNLGLSHAASRWLLFLDCDDWLAPNAMEMLLRAVAAHPKADVVVGRTIAVSESGHRHPYPDVDLAEPFSVLCCQGRIPIHSVLVRSACVLQAGGFDLSLRTSEDWDLWQRLARSGAEFVQTSARVAFYRSRPTSLSKNVHQVAVDALEVMRRGHGPDPRVGKPLPAYAHGGPSEALRIHEVFFVLWSCARDIARGGDGLSILSLLPDGPAIDFDPDMIGELIATGMADMVSRPARQLGPHWSQWEPKVRAILEALFPSENSARLRSLAMSVAKARINAESQVGHLQLERAKSWAADEGQHHSDALQLRLRASALGVIALPRLGAVNSQWIARTIIAQSPRFSLSIALGQTFLWASPAFWAGAACELARVRGLGTKRLWRNAPAIPRLARQRLRAAAFAGLRSALTAHLRPALRSGAGCDHERAVDGLRHEAKIVAEGFPAQSVVPATDTNRVGVAPRAPGQALAWDALFRTEDPWGYGQSLYESRKTAHTLELTALVDDPDVLELGCAEGHFTRLLAPTSKRVLAMDISQTAVARARQRCRDLPNTDFRCLDLAREPLPGAFDLVVCSEVLYYLGSRLPRALANISKCLKPGGLLVTTNANQIGDEPSRTGFDWGHECGAHTIGKMIQAIDGFTLEREIRTPLYRVQAFRWRGDAAAEARIDDRALDIPLEDRLARAVVWGGGESRISTLKREFSVSIPILVYHRVAPDGDGPPGLDRYRTTPQAFENQISFLRRHGYWGLTIRQLARALEKKMPLPGRPVMLTFDDGYSDFATHAWPVLEKHDFPATLFVVPAKVGGCADWDSEFGPPAPLLSWEQLAELARRGVEIESHAFTHRSLARLELAEVYRECLYSRAAVERGTGRSPTAICYPFGAHDRVVEQIAFESGYSLGFTTNVGLAHVTSAKMSLPRLEVSGRDDLQTFARKLNRA